MKSVYIKFIIITNIYYTSWHITCTVDLSLSLYHYGITLNGLEVRKSWHIPGRGDLLTKSSGSTALTAQTLSPESVWFSSSGTSGALYMYIAPSATILSWRGMPVA